MGLARPGASGIWGFLSLAGDTRLSIDCDAQLGRLSLRVLTQVGLRRRASSVQSWTAVDDPARAALTEAEGCLREHPGTRPAES